MISQGSDELAKLHSPTRAFAAGMHKSILGNPGVIHSVPTAFMNSMGTKWITAGLPRMAHRQKQQSVILSSIGLTDMHISAKGSNMVCYAFNICWTLRVILSLENSEKNAFKSSIYVLLITCTRVSQNN